jgi:hypothetical protein
MEVFLTLDQAANVAATLLDIVKESNTLQPRENREDKIRIFVNVYSTMFDISIRSCPKQRPNRLTERMLARNAEREKKC